ncbi:hypothetical protein FRC08_010522 [Ceratobasidium sp. 394]|nr:hypothetical protein FRC08_010522 [Ceratobasidium sp. 394]KAG9095865.1 hypothetical protein FS749_009586 [Ceratobasidium sp. UAMH 11750]
MLALNTLAVGAASLFAVAAANHGHILHRSHHHNITERSEHHLQKRFGGRATYYQTGMGACGIYNNPSDKIVALNAPQFGDGYPGPNCFKMITICKGSNCHGAQITDMCPGCDYGALDMSQSLFEQFADTNDGVFQMTWTFNDDKPDPPKTTEKPDPPKPTKKPDPPKEPEPKPEPKPEPTTSREPPTTTSKKHTSTTKQETTSTPEPTTSTSSSTSSKPTTTSTSEEKSSAASTSELPTGTANASATPSATAGPGSGSSSGSNWEDLNQVMLAMGRLATAAHGGQ